MKHLPPLVFEVNTRCYLRELRASPEFPVTLAEIPDADINYWRQSGFTHIWFMGVWETGPLARNVALAQPELLKRGRELLPDFTSADILGSPYAIAGYRVVEEFGGERALITLRDRLHSSGLRLLLDFIPNHIGLDHPWICEHPEFLIEGSPRASGSFLARTSRGERWLMHGRDPYFPPWIDTAQLNYWNPNLKAAVIEDLVSVAKLCDGVRCDMAMLVLANNFSRIWGPALSEIPVSPQEPPEGVDEFWRQAIVAVKTVFPEFLMVAEAYWDCEAALLNLGFDFAYDKTVYDLIVANDDAGLTNYLAAQSTEKLGRSLHFLENHDEQRVRMLFPSLARHRSAVRRVFSLPGMKLIHQGQMEGALHRVPVQFARRPAEKVHQETQRLYQEMLTERLSRDQ